MSDILLIDGKGQNSNALLKILAELNLNVVSEKHLPKAKKLLRQYKFTLLFLNGLSPAELQQAAQLEIPTQLPVLILTNVENDYTSVNHLPDSRFVDIISPPLLQEKIAHRIQFLLRAGQLAEDLLSSQGEVVALQEKIVDLHRSVDGHNSFLELISRRDGLTGLYNRRHFNSIIKELFEKTKTGKEDLALIILNIDYFSEINKSCGQDFGDFVLNELSARLTSASRKNDICFRLSGEDFAILMPSTTERTAIQKAEQLRLSSEQKSYDNGHYVRTVTISVGVAALRSHGPKTHEELINMADQALFIAKSEGRNRCMLHTPIDRSSYGSSEQNFKILQDTISRILDKTKVSTMRSLQLLAQAIMEGGENEQIRQAQYIAELIGKEMRFPPMLIETFKNSIMLLSSIRYLMHNEMINKTGALSDNEWEVISDFPYKLAQITELFDYFSKERSILLHHGEKFDGTGYPEGLKGEEIPIGARIFSLANAVAAMNADRPYRKKLAPGEILDELLLHSGRQFDPKLVLKLIDVIEERGILHIERSALNDARKKISLLLLE